MGAASSRAVQGTSQLFGASDVLDERKRSSIVELLSLPLSRIPWQEDASMLRNLPGPDVLDHLVDLYFLHFHEVTQTFHSTLRGLVASVTDCFLTALAHHSPTYL
jgi:hypothetical protein